MEKIVENGLLYDFYGVLLTEHQQRVYELAVNDDMSLNEIAQAEGVSKQAVYDLLRRTTRQLQRYEDRLHLMERFRAIEDDCSALEKQIRVCSEKDEQRSRMLQTLERLRSHL